MVITHPFAHGNDNSASLTLTVRLLSHSESKKTVLINRGSDDGLSLGIQSQFSAESGVVARGELIELSPQRSLWSLYRLPQPELVTPDMILQLTQIPPVKLTSDESRNLIREEWQESMVGEERVKDLPFSELPADIPLDLWKPSKRSQMAQQAQLQGAVNTQVTGGELDLSDHPWEVSLRLALQSSSATTETIDKTQRYEGDLSLTNFFLGIERFFPRAGSIFKRLSVTPFIEYQQMSLLSYEGTLSDTTLINLGALASLYLGSLHRAPGLVFDLHGLFARGTIEDSVATGSRSLGTGAETSIVKGDSQTMGIGVGMKFYTSERWSLQANLDYLTRMDQFEIDPLNNNQAWDRESTGPRLQLGLGKRF